MRALTVMPGKADSAELTDVAEPVATEDTMLVEPVAVGLCGTDEEIVAGQYGWAPPGRDRLVLGHESLGSVVEAPPGCGFAAGDLVVGIVRHRDPLPCPNCAVGEWDMCSNGRYTEHGIKELDGFIADRYRLDVGHAVKVDPSLGIAGVLMEPTTVVAKAWEHIERVGSRARWVPRRALVTGAGPVGLLAALLGVRHGIEVAVLDLVEHGPKPARVRELGATYHTGSIEDLDERYDVVVECTGVGKLAFDALRCVGSNGVVSLVGTSPSDRTIPVAADRLNEQAVLRNVAMFGTVNANRRHYEQAVSALAEADRGWLERLITRRVSLNRWAEALERQTDDIKVVIDWSS